jgi:glyoxalase family protein
MKVMKELPGIHHVTAIAGDPQRNLDFYREVLGLRLIKRTVNFDDPESYHFYFGDAQGSPGTILTFFAWPDARPGRPGIGQAAAVAFSIGAQSLSYWTDRLRTHGVEVGRASERFGEPVLEFRDPDGLLLELAAQPEPRTVVAWDGGTVPEEHAIRGFRGITLLEADLEQTAAFLEESLGFRPARRVGKRRRFTAGTAGQCVDVMAAPDQGRGRISVGSVHHVAWRTADEEEQLAWRMRLLQAGLSVTAVADRKYFRSIYFREPGGVLFEIATDGPGFTVDELREELGSHLALPLWLELLRAKLEAALPPLETAQLVRN